MERLTKKQDPVDLLGDGTICNYGVPNHYEYHIATAVANKLGKLEDIEEKLGCSLDIIFDALYRGIVCTPHPFYTHEKIYPKKEYNVVQLFQFYYLKVEDGVVDIKDYGKTWWLKEDRSE